VKEKRLLTYVTFGKYSPCSKKKGFLKDMNFEILKKRLRKYVTFDEPSTLKAQVFFSIILFETFLKNLVQPPHPQM
jgi:hypothetical protein